MYLTILIITIVLFIVAVVKDLEIVGLLFFLIVGALVAPVGSAIYHYHDLGTVEAQHLLIEVQQQRIDNLQSRLKNLPVSSGITLNSDSPARSLIKALASAENSLAEQKMELAEAHKSIATREIGPFSFVTKLF